MPETVTNDLLYEVLKALQAGQARTESALGDVNFQLIRLREDINALRSDGLRQERTIAAMQVDIDRINKRLGLADPAH